MKWMKSDKVWPVGIVVVMAAFVAWMLGVVTISIMHRPQLTSDNYYAEGFNLRDVQQRKAAANDLGWQVHVRPLPIEQAAMPLVEIAVTEKTGAACDSLTGSVAFYRPSNNALDIESAAFFPIGSGKYLVKTPRSLERGSWQAVLNLSSPPPAGGLGEVGLGKPVELRVNFFVES